MNCRHCGGADLLSFLDLGFAPPSNAYLTPADLDRPEVHFPLRLFVCPGCWLVQTQDYAQAHELFSADYAYFSSTSTSWLRHAADYANAIVRRLSLNGSSHVIEIASNDGYLLRNFLAAGIPCLGIEPTASTAAVAEKLGIPVLRRFFGEELARELVSRSRAADLVVGNNVFAHVPDINDFTRGLKVVLKPGGTITLEFPHLMRLLEFTQFDTVYHEHYSYLSLHTVARIFAPAGLKIVDAEELPTHGGSLRVYAAHADDARAPTPGVVAILNEETRRGMQRPETYLGFQPRANRIKDDFVAFLIDAKRRGKSAAAYGAAAKGNTLLNYAGIRPDLLPFVCDAAPAKQGRLLPGSHIPVLPPAAIFERRPEYVVILPWNIRDEVAQQLAAVRDWGGRFVTAVPQLAIV